MSRDFVDDDLSGIVTPEMSGRRSGRPNADERDGKDDDDLPQRGPMPGQKERNRSDGRSSGAWGDGRVARSAGGGQQNGQPRHTRTTRV